MSSSSSGKTASRRSGMPSSAIRSTGAPRPRPTADVVGGWGPSRDCTWDGIIRDQAALAGDPAWPRHPDRWSRHPYNRRQRLEAVRVGRLAARPFSEVIMKAILSAALVLGLCGLVGARGEKADPVGTW